MAAAYKRSIEAAPDAKAYRDRGMVEEGLLRLRSPLKAAHTVGVIELIDPCDTRRLASTFAKLAQSVMYELGWCWWPSRGSGPLRLPSCPPKQRGVAH